MKRKKEAGHGRRDRGDEKPLSPTVQSLAREESEQDNEAGENRDQADQGVNDRVDVKYDCAVVFK